MSCKVEKLLTCICYNTIVATTSHDFIDFLGRRNIHFKDTFHVDTFDFVFMDW